MPAIGFSTIQIALVTAIFGAVAAFWGGRRARTDLAASARNAVFIVFGLVTLAVLDPRFPNC